MRRYDSEPPKAIMQDTYRAAVDRLLADVAGARIGETVTDHAADTVYHLGACAEHPGLAQWVKDPVLL